MLFYVTLHIPDFLHLFLVKCTHRRVQTISLPCKGKLSKQQISEVCFCLAIPVKPVLTRASTCPPFYISNQQESLVLDSNLHEVLGYFSSSVLIRTASEPLAVNVISTEPKKRLSPGQERRFFTSAEQNLPAIVTATHETKERWSCLSFLPSSEKCGLNNSSNKDQHL